MSRLEFLEINFDFQGQENSIYPVLLMDDKEMILVDCGYKGFLKLIKNAAMEKGIDISSLTKIIITHHDFDHMGSLAQFKREYPNIEIISSYEEEKYISGKKKSLRLEQAERIYDSLPESEKEGARMFQRLLENVETVKVDICIEDKFCFNLCGGVEIIETPGHMPGHIAVYVRGSKTLITGDALVIEGEELTLANPQYTLDIDKAKGSVKKLLTYDIEKIICYHGGEYKKDIRASLEAIVKE